MAADSSLDQPYRDLALIRQTTIEFDALKPQQDVTLRITRKSGATEDVSVRCRIDTPNSRSRFSQWYSRLLVAGL